MCACQPVRGLELEHYSVVRVEDSELSQKLTGKVSSYDLDILIINGFRGTKKRGTKIFHKKGKKE